MCDFSREKLTAYHDGELIGEDCQIVEKHINQCQDCQSFLQELRLSDALIRDAGDELPPEGYWESFEEKVLARVSEAARGPGAVVGEFGAIPSGVERRVAGRGARVIRLPILVTSLAAGLLIVAAFKFIVEPMLVLEPSQAGSVSWDDQPVARPISPRDGVAVSRLAHIPPVLKEADEIVRAAYACSRTDIVMPIDEAQRRIRENQRRIRENGILERLNDARYEYGGAPDIQEILTSYEIIVTRTANKSPENAGREIELNRYIYRNAVVPKVAVIQSVVWDDFSGIPSVTGPTAIAAEGLDLTGNDSAYVQIAFGNFAESIEVLDRNAEVADDPDERAEAHFWKGYGLEQLQQYPDAITCYTTVAEQYSHNSYADDALYRAGQIAERQLRDYAQAVFLYTQLAESYKASNLAVQALNNRAGVNEKRYQDFKRAIEDSELAEIRNAFIGNPADNWYASQARIRRDFLMANMDHGGEPLKMYFMALDLGDKQRKDEAARLLAKIAEKFPDAKISSKALLRLAQYQEEANQHEEAVNTYNRILELTSDEGELEQVKSALERLYEFQSIHEQDELRNAASQ